MVKKKGGRSNKKKKGQNRQQQPTSAASSTSQRNTDSSNVPTFHSNKTEKQDTSAGMIYDRYKRCTSMFRDWLRSVMPQSFPLEKVVDLQRATDDIFDQSMGYLDEEKREPPVVVPQQVMDNLSECIKLRQEVSGFYTDNDKKHRFMIDTLKYCRRMLGFSRNMVRVAAEVRPVEEAKDEIGGRFNALLEIDEEEEEEAKTDMELIRKNRESKEEGFRSSIQRPPEPEEEYSIDDLINGDDRFQAWAFILSLNTLMNVVQEHFVLLKQVMRGEHVHDAESHLQLMLECTVVSNMAMESVSSMEATLAADYPHLNSFYGVLALVFLYPVIAEIEGEMGQNARRKHPNLAKRFAGDIVECAFRNKGEQKMDLIVKRLAQNSGVHLSRAKIFADQILTATRCEIQLAAEEAANAAINAHMRSIGASPHMWFCHLNAIGGDRCILNAQSLVQKVLDVVMDATKLTPRPGFFGEMWDEESLPASRIRGDMDQFFAGDILPELIELCKRGPIRALPDRMELIPLLDLLETQLRNRKSPVRVSLTFGFHAMLSSVFLLQGDGDVTVLARSTKQSYNKLFQQLEEDSKSDLPQAPTFHSNLKTFKPLVNLPKPVGPVGSSTSENNAFWNPVVGGEFLLLATYLFSIGLGSATVDSLGQLRFSLHLYNALKKRKLIQDVAFLDDLDKVFDKTRAVWVAGRPDVGGFAKHFWLAWGSSVEEATRRADAARRSTSRLVDLRRDQTRPLDEILPENYSASYRCIVQRDFSEEEADYTIQNANEKQKKDHEVFIDLLTRINMTRDSMDDDEDLVIPTNFTRIGCILNEFICGLSKALKWDPLVKEVVATCPDEIRNGIRADGRRARKGGFETSDVNLERQALATFVADLLSKLDSEQAGEDRLSESVAAAAYIVEFFGDVEKERYTFMVNASREVEANNTPNPLLGTYPPGRTGRTPRDPLAAFFHIKLSKSGEPTSRLIKQGKRTPFIMNASAEEQMRPGFERSEYIKSPYRESGSKLVRQCNGRYRHIASYSFDELMALGWDGAKYVSSGNHAAKGLWCPFVCGYDSDPDDRYDPIDVAAGRRADTIGLLPEEVGLYMDLPNKKGLVQLKK